MTRFRYFNKNKISLLPRKPGVYLFKKGRETLYIGKAENIRERVRNHFQQPSFRDNLFISKVKKIGYLKTGSEIEALILEANLIKKYQPKFNVLWRDDKNYFFVGITKEEFPRVFITHQIKTQKSKVKSQNYSLKLKTLYMGPFVDGKALKQTLKVLRKVFPYRTCKKIPKKPCLWYQLGRCPAPCLLKSNLASQLPNAKEKIKNECQKNARAILKIFQGKPTQLLKILKKEMTLLANSQEYERAAKVRDQIEALENILKHAKIFQTENIKEITNWQETEKTIKRLLKIKKKIKRIEGYDVSNIQGAEATGSMVVFENGKPNKAEYRKFKIHPVKSGAAEGGAGAPLKAGQFNRVKIAGKPNDVAMIKEIISRRLNHPEWNFPQVILIDGGVAQLNAALKVKSQISKLKTTTQKSKLKGIKMLALAKRKNELYIEGKNKPVLLKDLSQELSNLILQIRDEAHRFALAYHRKLRSIDFQLKS